MTDYLPIPTQARPVHPVGGLGATALSTNAENVDDKEARAAAEALEAAFLTEMLKASGLGEQENSLSGGYGEDHFASFHRQAIAERMVQSGGLGLAEAFYRSMMEARDDG